MAETPKSSDIPKRTGSWWSKNWFYTVLIAVAVIGGLSAFGLPLIVSQPFSAGDSISTLRQAILAATGGVLAILTLWENRRKNIQEKEKNDQDHTRQVHAERRSRYAKAIEQLADEKAPIRLGGIYTLVKLVDEWLADEKTLPNEEERREEGQVIINNLCAYIRSSFDLVSKIKELSESTEAPKDYMGGTQQFIKDQARFREEKELRLTILDAVKARINVSAITQEDKTKKLLKGSWSDFNYEFSNTHFFYPVNFTNSYFGASSNFSGATFTGYADFSGATFAYRADFSRATFTGYANSIGYADFSGASFTGYANFSKATFTEGADFSGAKFTQNANFSRATFTGVIFFAHGAYFSGAKFTQNANFSGATFTGLADFSGAAFQTEPIFESILDNEAGFSCKVHPESYNFEVSYDSPYKIETEEQEYNGVKFRIPKGAILFDPDEPSEQKDDNDS
ncbi:pentapeptide repeat-containing protein [Rothia dentocariosa]|jgi:putative uncharacterized protein (fragment)|uniref:pentapeptide repeat-containing protein n=1 Tax=Rothia dentocariosa TaxID=2047 RepID=UPI003C734FEE